MMNNGWIWWNEERRMMKNNIYHLVIMIPPTTTTNSSCKDPSIFHLPEFPSLAWFAETSKTTASEQTSWRHLVLSIRNHHGFPRLSPLGLSLQFTGRPSCHPYQGGTVESLWRSRVNWGLHIPPGTPCTPFGSILYPLCHLLLPWIPR